MSDHTITAETRKEIVRQIGQIHIMMISGGRVTAIADGVEMPVSQGYRVRVRYTAGDDYTVQRVFQRGSKEWIRGERTEVYCDEVGEAAYYASCFRSYDETEWVTK